MDTDNGRVDLFDTLVVSFIFVPHGCPEPHEWLAAHLGAIRIPAVMVPRPAAGDEESKWSVSLDLEDVLTRIEGSVADYAVPAVAPENAVPLIDDNGAPVTNAAGAPMLRPAGFDPHFFVDQGLKDGKSELQLQLYGRDNGVPAALGYEYAAKTPKSATGSLKQEA